MAAPRNLTELKVLDEERLKQISRSIRSFVPSNPSPEEDVDKQTKAFKLLLDHAFYTASAPNLTVTHRVAAWNTLCSLIDQSLESTIPAVKDTVWNQDVWTDAFELYLQHGQNARPKSSRQLLSTLTNALRKSPHRDLKGVKAHATNKLVAALLDYEDPPAAKVSAQLLSQLLQKDVLDIDLVFQAFPWYHSDQSPNTETERLLVVLFDWLGRGDFGSTIAHLVSIVLDKLSDSIGQATGQPIWTRPLQEAFSKGSVNTDDLRAHVLPALFKSSFADFASFLERQGLRNLTQSRSDTTNDSAHEELLYTALQTGKELGLLDETEDDEVFQTETALLVPISYIGNLLFQTSRPARLTGLSLLITSHSATRPFSRKSLRLIRRGLDVAFADVDADFRGDVFGVFQKLVDRLRSITATLARQTGTATDLSRGKHGLNPRTVEESLTRHRGFLQWLSRFLCWQLCPTASYQRHISALKCLNSLARSGLDGSVSREYYSKSALGGTKWPFQMDIISNEMQRLLSDLILDPFDDVRQTASDILALVYSKDDENAARAVESALERAETLMLATGRADHADGVAHLYALQSRLHAASASDDSDQPSLAGLLDKLEQMLQVARGSLPEAVARYPLHGLLTSLRYVLDKTKLENGTLYRRLHVDLQEIWKVVKPVLCNDAPEGYTPDELEEGLDTTKETLSYCWRALKEASLLMSTLVAAGQLDESDLLEMSDLCFTQLAELRHRGAFSTVAQTWITCCIKCKDLKSPQGLPMLTFWYTKVLNMLRRNVTINTRRSAGIPSLLCGILVADKSNKLLASAIADLETIARHQVDPSSAEEGSLPQVHAMNCLKDVLKNTRLGEQSERYVPTALQLAADALRSDVWAIRNCGLMLFRAVIDRLLGTDQSHFDDEYASQKHISAHQHPRLLDVILDLLPKPTETQPDSSTRYEGVFPALQLLQHTQVPDRRLAQVHQAVEKLTASPSWHVRDKAARSLAALLDKLEPGRVTHNLFVLNGVGSQNALHGALLTVMHYIYRRKRMLNMPNAPAPEIDDIHSSQHENGQNSFLSDLWRLSREGQSFVTQAAALDVIRAYHDAWPGMGNAMPGTDFEHLQILSIQKLAEPSKAALRQATARLMAQRIGAEEHLAPEAMAGYVDWAMDWTRIDQNAGEHFLKALKPTDGASQLVYSICAEILRSNLDVELKCEAQDLLLTLSSSNWTRDASLYITTDDSKPTNPRPYLNEPGCNQRYADQWLQIRAVNLDICAANYTDTECAKNVLVGIVSWVDDCVDAIDGNGLHTREAAALAIARLDHLLEVLTAEGLFRDQLIRLCMAVYELLNDDDEDTRLRAAGVTQKIIAAGSAGTVQDMEPITASQKLLAYSVAKWPSSAIVAETAFKRAFHMSFTWNRVLLAPPSVAEQVGALLQSDTALFVEEKQNLYIDEAREVRLWSQVVPRLSEVAIARELIDRLASWVLSGLQALAQHTEEHADGALGWSSKADVFKLALQVIYGAEMLLSLVKKGIRLPVRPSELRRQLFNCAVAFEKGEVSCLLQWEIKRIISDSVVHKLTAVHDHMMKIRSSS